MSLKAILAMGLLGLAATFGTRLAYQAWLDDITSDVSLAPGAEGRTERLRAINPGVTSAAENETAENTANFENSYAGSDGESDYSGE